MPQIVLSLDDVQAARICAAVGYTDGLRTQPNLKEDDKAESLPRAATLEEVTVKVINYLESMVTNCEVEQAQRNARAQVADLGLARPAIST